MYFLDKDKHGSFFNYLKNDYSLTDLIIKLFKLENPYFGSVGDPNSKVINELDKHSSFINARFEYNNIRIKTFLLLKNDDGYSLYFFHPFIPKELDINSIYISYDVLLNNNINITNIYNIYINNKYVLKDELDVESVFIVDDSFNDEKIINLVKNYNYDYGKIIKEMDELNDSSSVNYQINRNCFMCEHFNECFKDGFPFDSILHLVSSQNKFDMYNDGLLLLKDFDINRLEGTSLQYAQIMASRNNGLFIDKELVKNFMESMNKRPICFIDFEWDTYLLPKYKNMKCFGALPFEFCLYILDENYNLINKSYVGLNDCRVEFINKLIESIPNEGPIVAFNSFSAEVLRLNELSDQFPEYKDKLSSISKRFVDLAEPFSKGMLYDVKYAGKLSVKSLVSVIAGIDYKKLNIKDGLEAVFEYRKYSLNKDESIKNSLIEYCNQDAYSLYIIYNYLNDLIKA